VKAAIHPEYVETTITCACGEVIHTRSTQPNIRVEKLVDTAGRIERFQKKYGAKKP
jgi:large subunit ribosomal protein L31